MKREPTERATENPTLKPGWREERSLTASHEESMVRMVSVESLVRMVSGVAHELKNPLGILLMGIEYFSDRVVQGDPTAAVVMADMREAVERSDAIVRAMVRYAASKPLVRVSENLNDAVEAAMRELQADRISVSMELADRLPRLLLDRARIEQAIIHVLTNSIEAMPEGGSLHIRTFADKGIDGRDDPSAIVVTIEDTGPGIPAKLLGLVFLPFFTKNKPGKHTGLGLTIAQTIVQAHGGNITIRNRASGGAVVSIAFYLHDAPSDPSGS
jgi:signal transduction histidine kinase